MLPLKRGRDTQTPSVEPETTPTPKKARQAAKKAATPVKDPKSGSKASTHSPSARQKDKNNDDMDPISCGYPSPAFVLHPEAAKLFAEVKVNFE